MRHSKASLFLMELIVALFFFSLASAVCIRMFAKANTLGVRTIETNHTVSAVQNFAETWYACQGDITALSALFPQGDWNEEGFCIWYDADWEISTCEAARYQACICEITDDAEGDLQYALIQVIKYAEEENELLYENVFYLHIADRKGDL